MKLLQEIELIKELSLKYNIISRFTSFVGVDEGSSEAMEGVGEMLVRQHDSPSVCCLHCL